MQNLKEVAIVQKTDPKAALHLISPDFLSPDLMSQGGGQVSARRSSASRLEIRLDLRGPVWSAVLCGDLDRGSAPILTEMIGALVEERTDVRVVLDMCRLYSVDSAGITALRETQDLLIKGGGQLALAAIRPRVQSILARSGLGSAFTTYRTLDEAIQTDEDDAVEDDVTEDLIPG
jgi:anti-anti-sigma factor